MFLITFHRVVMQQTFPRETDDLVHEVELERWRHIAALRNWAGKEAFSSI